MFNNKLFQTALNGLTLFMMMLLSFQLAKTITTTQIHVATIERTAKHNSDLIAKNSALISQMSDLTKNNVQLVKDHDEEMSLLRDSFKDIEAMKATIDALEKRIK